MIWIRISDARFLGRIMVRQSKWWIRVDSSIPLVNFGPSDLGLLILIQTIPNEHSLFLSGTFNGIYSWVTIYSSRIQVFTRNRLRVDYYLFFALTGGDQMLIGFASPRSFRYFFVKNTDWPYSKGLLIALTFAAAWPQKPFCLLHWYGQDLKSIPGSFLLPHHLRPFIRNLTSYYINSLSNLTKKVLKIIMLLWWHMDVNGMRKLSNEPYVSIIICDVKYIWNNSYMNCGCRWTWRMIIAVNFPI